MNSLENEFEEGKKDDLYVEIFIKEKGIPVREILRLLSQGKKYEDILIQFPNATISDIQTCLNYACELVGAIDFKNAVKSINTIRKKKQAIVDKINSILNDKNELDRLTQSFIEKFADNNKNSSEKKV